MKAQSLDSLLISSEELYRINETYLSLPVPQNVFKFNNKQPEDSTITDYQIAIKQLEKDAYRKDLGLVFKANAQYNFNDDLDEESNRITRSRLKTELEWNILKEGFLNNKHKAQQKNIEISLLQQKKAQEKRIAWRRQFRIDYTYSINQELLTLFKHKEAFLNRYFDILSVLHYQKLIKREQLIEVGEKITIARKEGEHIKQYNKLIKDSVSSTYIPSILPILIIKKEPYQFQIAMASNRDSLQAALVYNKASWLDNISLSAYANYNWTQSDINTRNFASVGLRLRVPLRFNENESITKAKIRLTNTIDNTHEKGQHNQVVTYFASYREKIRDLHVQHKNWEIVQERKRVLQVLKKELNNPEAGIQLLALQEEQYDILENILILKKQLYTSLSHLYELYGDLKTQPFIFKKRPSKDVIILNDKSSFPHTFQKAFLKAHNITSVSVLDKNIVLQQKWKSSGFKIRVVSKYTKETMLHQWMREVLKTIKTTNNESIFISEKGSSNPHLKRTKN
ncbi:hypothetical protein GCM10011444_04830 [Winogradskyella haliclonae]|uniref:Outer membrane efflux protein n=1 Tax=Winogradskyella haliclonae TaxID=2048558 RepID=A0ABQ2BUS5_9FLAO|nr:hypothetical protein GCM10011444_04830 [Winogradskyella haliclonae]